MSFDKYDMHQSRNEEAMKSCEASYLEPSCEPCHICEQIDCTCPVCIECGFVKEECSCPYEVKLLAQKKELALNQLEKLEHDNLGKNLSLETKRELYILETLIRAIKLEQSAITAIDKKLSLLSIVKKEYEEKKEASAVINCDTRIYTLKDLKNEFLIKG